MKRALLTLVAVGLCLPFGSARLGAQATPPLSFFTNYFVTGDYQVGGTSLWRKGVNGRASVGIKVTGVPANADIVAAFLYVQTAERVQWSGIDHATFNGYDLGPGDNSIAKALNWDQATKPCWSVAFPGGRRLVTYRADVLRFLRIDPATNKFNPALEHTLTVPDYGYTYGDDDEAGIESIGGHSGARAVGASLLVVYRDPARPYRGVVIYDGAFTKQAFSTVTLGLAGWYQAATAGANSRLTAIVGDGRPFLSERVRVNGALVATNPFVSANGPKWDNATIAGFPVTTPGVTLEVSPNGLLSDCVSFSAVVMSVDVQDYDRDGLLDVWERATVAAPLAGPDGRPLPPLGSMGADPAARDLFVEIGAMATSTPTSYGGVTKPAHSHAPTPGALALIAEAFRRQAIQVHFDVGNGYVNDVPDLEPHLIRGALARGGETIAEQVTVCAPGTEPWECQFSAYPGTVGWKSGYRFLRDEYINRNGLPEPPPGQDDPCDLPGSGCRRRFDPDRQQMFHYALFAHAVGLPKSEDPNHPDFHVPRTNTGIGDFPGGDVMITLGAFDDADGLPIGTTFMQASTLMHELGHNLELRHGGGALEPNCKPTYFSVMNYLYQLRGLLDDLGKPTLDFSSAGPAILPVNESSLPTLQILPYRLGWFAPLATSYLDGIAKVPTRFCNGADIPAGFPASAVSVRVDATKANELIDWNADNVPGSGSAQDVNFDGGPPQLLRSHDDWSAIRLNQVGSRRNVGTLFTVPNPNVPGGLLDIVGPLSVNLGKGDLGKGDLGKGDLGKGDLGKGDLGKGDLGKGDLGKGDLGKGDLGKGDLGKGDLGGGDLFDPGPGFPNAPPGGELDFETFASTGSTPAYEFRACVVGAECDAPDGAEANDVLVSWTPAGGVKGYEVYRVLGETVPDASLWGAPVETTPLLSDPLIQQVDTTGLVHGQKYTYFVVAVYEDGTRSSHSNPWTITAVNPPLAEDDAYSTNEDTALVVAAPGVLANDNASGFQAQLVSGAAHGTVMLAATGAFTYTPAANYFGSDAFTYRLTDGSTTTAAATVSLTVYAVNDAPVAVNDSYTVDQGEVLAVPAPGVLGNDSDLENGLAAVLVAGPSKGTLTLNANGSFTYTPSASYSGADSFTYRASDGLATSNLATVSITVKPAGYGFVNVKNLPPSAGKTFKPSAYGTLVEFVWKFTKNGAVTASADAQPSVTIRGPNGYNQTFTPANCGSFGFTFEYSSTYKQWQFNWKPKNAAVGTYYVYVSSGKTGQSFPTAIPAAGAPQTGFPVIFKY